MNRRIRRAVTACAGILGLVTGVTLAVTSSASAYQSTQQTVYTIQNVNSNLYLGVLGGSVSNGAEVVQWAGNGSLDQQWQLVQVSGM